MNRRRARPVARIILLASALSVIVGDASAARQFDVSLGLYHAPDESATGYVAGLATALWANERVAILLGADFTRTSQNVTEVVLSAAGPQKLESDQDRLSVPIHLTARISLTNEDSNLRPFLRFGGGYTAANSSHTNDAGESGRTWRGTMFLVGVGVLIDESFFIQADWRGGSLDRSTDELDLGLPIDESYEPTATTLQIGFRF